MACNLPALRSTLVRQSTAGHVVLLLLAIWMILPYMLDRYRGEPFISSKLTAMHYDDNLIIHESINVKFPNRGTRTNILVDLQDRIMCSKNYMSFWESNREREWFVPAFVGCEIPLVPFRICSVFSVYSKSGIERKFGLNKEFCTEVVYPVK